MTTKRQQRMNDKYRNHLLCENCNRWTLVSADEWKDALKLATERNTPYVCLCLRPTCVAGRPEGLLSKLTDTQRDALVYGIAQVHVPKGVKEYVLPGRP